jgi:hypothetical protein
MHLSCLTFSLSLSLSLSLKIIIASMLSMGLARETNEINQSSKEWYACAKGEICICTVTETVDAENSQHFWVQIDYGD